MIVEVRSYRTKPARRAEFIFYGSEQCEASPGCVFELGR